MSWGVISLGKGKGGKKKKKEKKRKETKVVWIVRVPGVAVERLGSEQVQILFPLLFHRDLTVMWFFGWTRDGGGGGGGEGQ